MIGNTVGNYKIVEKIGEGGMGSVFKGIDLMLEREVAIKALRTELARQPHIVERFRAEAVTLAKLNHPNIATLHSFFRQGDDFFMVMEFVRGETLDRVLKKFGGMPSDTAIPLFSHALEGIDHAHRLGIIHRDIKPANMMLTETGSIKVMDFGIARVLGSARMTKQGNVIGTIEYMSPEQVRGLETDARSDIYSLGILLYEMLTGRVPFTSNSEYDLMRSQIEDAPIPPRDFAPTIPLPVEEAIMRALAKNSGARFPSAGEFRTALLSGMGVAVVPVPSAPPPLYAEIPTQVGERSLTIPGESTRPTVPIEDSFYVEGGTGDHLRRARQSAADAAANEARLAGLDAGPKETRLSPGTGASVAAPSYEQVVAGAPSYGPIPASAPVQAPSPYPAGYVHRPQTSIFSKLNWKYYVGAAGVLLLALVSIPLILLSFVRSSSPQPAPGNQSGSAPASARPAGQPAQPDPNQSAPATLPLGAESVPPGAGSEKTKKTDKQREPDVVGPDVPVGPTADGTAQPPATTTQDPEHPAAKPAGRETRNSQARDRAASARDKDNKNAGKPGKVGGFLKKLGGLLKGDKKP